MAIDWFTLVAQIINFLVLVWLLKRFLYGRIVGAMNERAEGIARQLEEAAQKRVEAEREMELFHAKNRELTEQTSEIVIQAKQEAAGLREELIATARAEADQLRAQWFVEMQREKGQLLEELRERIGQQVIAIARRALRELADAELEEQVLHVFLKRLDTLDAHQRNSVAVAMQSAVNEIEVCTTFPIAAALRKEIIRTLKTHFDESVDVRFENLPGLLCGVELRVRSRRLTWNLDSYLEGLEERVFETLDRNAGSYAKLV